jgi:hypothetical protein
MTTTSNKPKTWFWVVSALALVWNLMGVMAYITQVTMTPEAMQALPEDQQALYSSMPSWATGAFAIAVWGGALASILLLLRRKWATAVLILSMAAILVQMYHSFFVSNSFEVFGPGGLVMPIMIIVFAAGLIWFSRKATAEGWLK